MNIPVSHGPLSDATFDKLRTTVRDLVGKKRVFFYCASGNRVGVVLIPSLSMATMQACALIAQNQRVSLSVLATGFRKPAVIALCKLGLIYMVVSLLLTWQC